MTNPAKKKTAGVRGRLGISDLENRFHASRSTISRWVAAGKLATPHFLGGRRLWFIDEVEKFEADAGSRSPVPSRRHSRQGAIAKRVQLPVLSPTWPYVLAFAVRMEAKLEKNRHKGDREGWTKDTVHALFERLKEEVDEIDRLLSEDPIALQLVPDEAADVANFAMMIADVCGGVKP